MKSAVQVRYLWTWSRWGIVEQKHILKKNYSSLTDAELMKY